MTIPSAARRPRLLELALGMAVAALAASGCQGDDAAGTTDSPASTSVQESHLGAAGGPGATSGEGGLAGGGEHAGIAGGADAGSAGPADPHSAGPPAAAGAAGSEPPSLAGRSEPTPSGTAQPAPGSTAAAASSPPADSGEVPAPGGDPAATPSTQADEPAPSAEPHSGTNAGTNAGTGASAGGSRATPTTAAPPPTTAAPTPTTSAPAPTTGWDATAEASLLARLNTERANAGLGPLLVDANLVASARAQVGWMVGHATLAHQDLHDELGLGWTIVGENVGYGPGDGVIHNALVASPGHYANIVHTRYTHVGIGVMVDSNGRMWVAQVFGG